MSNTMARADSATHSAPYLSHLGLRSDSPSDTSFCLMRAPVAAERRPGQARLPRQVLAFARRTHPGHHAATRGVPGRARFPLTERKPNVDGSAWLQHSQRRAYEDGSRVRAVALSEFA